MFYDRLVGMCAERGMTISELLRSVGISPSAASRWKSKGYDPSPAVAKKIARFFDMSVADLMSGEITKPDTIEDAGLSEEELNFIKLYRQMAPANRALVSQLARSLQENQ